MKGLQIMYGFAKRKGREMEIHKNLINSIP